MLHIILTILKIIGIILAALLGFLLVVILLVLFVPIGYSAKLDNRKDLLVNANAWWLFHVLHISFLMEGMPSKEEGQRPVIKVRILGIPIIDTGRKKKEKEKTSVKEEVIIEETPSIEQKSPIEPSHPERTTTEKETPELTTQEIANTSPKQKADKKEKIKILKQKETRKAEEIEKPEVSEKKKFSPSAMIEKIKSFKENLKEKIQNIVQTIKKLFKKVDLIKTFLQNEENKQGIGKIFVSVKDILKHLLPNKIEGQVHFGMADPCTTGQVLGVLAMFYPYYSKSISIEPDFTGQVLEGNLYLKGYIQIVILCVIAFRLVLNANFRKLIKNVIQLKEEL